MFLHDLSRKICGVLQLNVTDPRYSLAVEAAFGSDCCYCSMPLEKDRASVEHLEGMNRFRLGLHIPGNVLLACRRCNGEKRRDDQRVHLALAEYGWESFLSHDSTRCDPLRKSCRHWATVWAEPMERTERLLDTRLKISGFRDSYPESMQWSRRAGSFLRRTVDSLYRDCQDFATGEIRKTVDEAFAQLSDLSADSETPSGMLER
jgi:hypothetical protein